MSDYEPKPMPARKAKVIRGARERIVETDNKLDREKDRLRGEVASHKRTAAERDLFAGVVNGPLEKAFIESLYRQAGAQMADLAMTELKESGILDGKTDFVIAKMMDCAREATDGIAETFLTAYMRQGGKVEASARQRDDLASTVVSSRIRLPAVEIAYAHRFDNARIMRGIEEH